MSCVVHSERDSGIISNQFGSGQTIMCFTYINGNVLTWVSVLEAVLGDLGGRCCIYCKENEEIVF